MNCLNDHAEAMAHMLTRCEIWLRGEAAYLKSEGQDARAQSFTDRANEVQATIERYKERKHP